MASNDETPKARDLFQSATAMLEQVRTKQISARELLDLHLAVTQVRNAEINAVVAMDEEGARQRASQADDMTARGAGGGVLHGLPMTVKDVFPVVGMPATGGFPHLADFRPEADAELVKRLRHAGANIFGKTNVPVGAGDHQSYNPVYGTTNNPWNVARTAGGSSGGSAAALAGGMTPLEIGSDVGGSIRCPAHFCGIYGHKPSFGIVPTDGHIPPDPGVFRRGEMAVAGPMARDPYDLELGLDVIMTPSADYDGMPRRAIRSARHNRLEEFRVGVWLEAEDFPVEASYVQAIEGLIDDLQKEGVSLKRMQPDVDLQLSQDTYFPMLFGEFCASLPAPLYDASLNAESAEGGQNGRFGEWIAAATGQTLRTWQTHLENREKLRSQWRRVFEDIDILICPVMTTLAFPHDHHGYDHVAQLARTMEVNGQQIPYLENLKWPGVITVAHLPSTTAPTRRLVGGLPAGAQIVSGFLDDRTTIRFAQLLHDRFGGYTMPQF